jgi:hypothetical protein
MMWSPFSRLLATNARCLIGGGGRTRTYEAIRRLIYSQLPLPLGTLPRRAALVRHHNDLSKRGVIVRHVIPKRIPRLIPKFCSICVRERVRVTLPGCR